MLQGGDRGVRVYVSRVEWVDTKEPIVLIHEVVYTMQ